MSDVPPSSDRFPLNALIQQVRDELVEAVRRRESRGEEKDREPAFIVENITLEINCVIETTEKIGGGAEARLFVVGLKSDAEKTYKSEQVHKITIGLSAHQIPVRNEGAKSAVTDTFKPVIVRAVTPDPPAWDPLILSSLLDNKISVGPVRRVILSQKGRSSYKELNEQLSQHGHVILPITALGKDYLQE